MLEFQVAYWRWIEAMLGLQVAVWRSMTLPNRLVVHEGPSRAERAIQSVDVDGSHRVIHAAFR